MKHLIMRHFLQPPVIPSYVHTSSAIALKYPQLEGTGISNPAEETLVFPFPSLPSNPVY
jgi:hypothetical protein